MANGLHNHADQVVRGLEEMLERLSVRLCAGIRAQIGLDVLDRSLQSIQAVVHFPEFVLGDDHLARRDLQRVGPAAGLVSPLPVGGPAELSRTAGPGELG